LVSFQLAAPLWIEELAAPEAAIDDLTARPGPQNIFDSILISMEPSPVKNPDPSASIPENVVLQDVVLSSARPIAKSAQKIGQTDDQAPEGVANGGQGGVSKTMRLAADRPGSHCGEPHGHFQSLAPDPITGQNPGDTNGHLCADHLRMPTYRVGACIPEHGRFISWRQID
jgi:hypothetical protein